MYKSERDISLFCEKLEDKPVLTVEDYPKWYSPYIIDPDGSVKKFDQSDWEEFDGDFYKKFGQTAVGDHIFNPLAVCYFAARNDMYVDSKALAALTRRWFNEFYNKGVWVEHYTENEE